MQSKNIEEENELQGLFRTQMSRSFVVDDTVITSLLEKEKTIMDVIENYVDCVENVDGDGIIYNYTKLAERIHLIVIRTLCKKIKGLRPCNGVK